MGPSVKHHPAPNQPKYGEKIFILRILFIPRLGLNPKNWMGQMQFVVWPKYKQQTTVVLASLLLFNKHE